MTKTVVGLFDSLQEAQNTIEDLLRFGISQANLSLFTRDQHGHIDHQHEVGATASESAGVGAVSGSLVGVTFGLLVGAGLLVVPGIGPVLAAGPLAAAIGASALGAGLGAAAGGLLGGLMGAGVPGQVAQSYVEGVRRGGTLLSVEVAAHSADDVHHIMLRNGALDLDQRVAEWRSASWDLQGVDGFAVGNLLVDPPSAPKEASSSTAYAATNVAEHESLPQNAPEPAAAAPASDLNSEHTRRAPHFAGANAVGGAISNMQGGSGSAQPGLRPSALDPDQPPAAPDLSNRDPARANHPAASSAQRDHSGHQHDLSGTEAAFLNHYQQWMGAGGQPYDYYKPGYQFGYALAEAANQHYSVWSEAERDARQAWERDARGSWEEFKQAIRFGWEKARGYV